MSDALFRRKAPGVMQGLLREFPVLDVEDVCAVLGNIGGESGGFTLLQEQKPTVAGSRGGFGWCQWTGPRRRAFEAWCAQHGLDPSSDDANFGYLVHELRTSEKGAIVALRNAAGLRNKVVAFERGFERAGVPHYEGRVRWAQLALQLYEAANPAEPEQLPDPEPEPLPPAEQLPEPAQAPLPWYKRLWLKVSGAIGLGGGLGIGGLTLNAETVYAICALLGVLALLGLLWIYAVPPRGQIRKGLS